MRSRWVLCDCRDGLCGVMATRDYDMGQRTIEHPPPANDILSAHSAPSAPSAPSASQQLPQIEPPTTLVERTPEIAQAFDARRYVVDAEVVDRDSLLDLLPRDRRRHGRPGPGPRRIHGRERPSPRVLVVVDQHPPARSLR